MAKMYISAFASIPSSPGVRRRRRSSGGAVGIVWGEVTERLAGTENCNYQDNMGFDYKMPSKKDCVGLNKSSDAQR